MRFEYWPSANREEYLHGDKPRRFRREFVEPKGRPRRMVTLGQDEAIISFDSPGGLSLAATLLDIAGGGLDQISLEQLQEFAPSDGWWGDLEPNSPGLRILREGASVAFEAAFLYEPPPFNHRYSPTSDPNCLLRIRIERASQESVWLELRANAFALTTLAKILVYLAQPGVPTRTRSPPINPTDSDPAARSILQLERREFQRDVPWAGLNRTASS